MLHAFLAGILLLAATPLALAESPMPDPIAPAVIGRPLDQIQPLLRARAKPPVAKANRPRPLAVNSRAVTQRPAVQAAAAVPAAPVAAQAMGAAPAAAVPHAPRQAVDDRIDTRTPVPDNVGQGTNLGRQALGPGAYLGSRAQALVRRYYEANPAAARAGTWKIGEPLPPRASLTGVPDDVRAALPKVPPGHQYVQVDGEVVLVAVQSRMVVDGVSRTAR